MRKSALKNFGFTLVELIVVIVILSILGTIAFTSLKEYSKYSRNTVRIADLKGMESLLEFRLVKSGKVPLPDQNVAITASGYILNYQGYLGGDSLRIINSTPAVIDPLSKEYYSYVINNTFTKYQILGFLEGGVSPSTENHYDKNNIFTLGSEIGIYINENSQPVQKYSTGIDIQNTSSPITSLLSNNKILSGTGEIASAMIGGGGLVGYWNFNQVVGSGFTDLSLNNSISSFAGGISLTGGVIGNAAYFDGINGEFTIPSIIGLGDSEGSPHTITAWIKADYIDSSCGNDSCRQWILLLGNPGTGSHHWLLGGTWGQNQLGIWSGAQKNVTITPGTWYHIAIAYNGIKARAYINGNIVTDATSEDKVTTAMNIKNAQLQLGKKQLVSERYYKGAIDELRVYNRALDGTEINNIFMTSRP